MSRAKKLTESMSVSEKVDAKISKEIEALAKKDFHRGIVAPAQSKPFMDILKKHSGGKMGDSIPFLDVYLKSFNAEQRKVTDAELKKRGF